MMELLEKLWRTFKLWLKILFVIALIVTYPRGSSMTDVRYVNEYEFRSDGFIENIGQLISSVWEKHSLGKTRNGTTVEEEIMRVMPKSLKLIISAFVLSFFLGVLKGIYDYRSSLSKRSFFGNSATWFLNAVPDFFFILLVQYGLLLLMRAGFPKIDIYGEDHWHNVVLAVFFLSIYPTVYIARITSSALSEQEGNEYLRVAKAKGLSQWAVIYKHALGNCWANILSHSTSLLMYILSNLLIVELLLFYHGAAYRLYDAMGGRALENATLVSKVKFEGPLVFGFIICFMVMVLITQLISQFARHYIDPRLRRDA